MKTRVDIQKANGEYYYLTGLPQQFIGKIFAVDVRGRSSIYMDEEKTTKQFRKGFSKVSAYNNSKFGRMVLRTDKELRNGYYDLEWVEDGGRTIASVSSGAKVQEGFERKVPFRPRNRKKKEPVVVEAPRTKRKYVRKKKSFFQRLKKLFA